MFHSSEEVESSEQDFTESKFYFVNKRPRKPALSRSPSGGNESFLKGLLKSRRDGGTKVIPRGTESRKLSNNEDSFCSTVKLEFVLNGGTFRSLSNSAYTVKRKIM